MRFLLFSRFTLNKRSRVVFFLKILGAFGSLLFFCEYLIYYIVLSKCDWPKLDPSKEDSAIKKAHYYPVKVMVLADTHLLGSRNGHWFDKLRREWQMRRAFQTAISLQKPDLVFVLGDLTDEGLFCDNDEFNFHVKRFHSMFAVPKTTKLYAVVGNHDIGFHRKMRPYFTNRFNNAFQASSSIQLISVKGNHFVLINSMALEGDSCFFCLPAQRKLINIGKTLKCTQGTYKGKCKHKLSLYSRPILMQHFPLYRPSDAECEDFDAAPHYIKKQEFTEKFDCLSKEATYQLLHQINPRLALSGHTHHGCTRNLSTGDGVEITIPSFSWRNKPNPNYALAVFTANNYAIVKCEMPKEYTVIGLYFIGSFLIVVWSALHFIKLKYKI